MEPKTISFKEVRRRGWIIVGDEVFDLTKFVPHHRGGQAIAQMRGMDATLPMVNAHGLRGELTPMPRGLFVGKLDEKTLDPVDQDLRALHADFKARGLFNYKTSWLVFDVVRMIGLFAVAALVMALSKPAAFVTFALAILNVMWWVHDVCHDSVFATKANAKRWAELASIIFVGTPATAYHYAVHRLHHGFTNVVGADHALETGPVVWHERQSGRSPAWFQRVQAIAWFLLILPITYPLFLVMALSICAKKGEYTKIAMTVARWAAAIVLFAGQPWWMLLGPLFIASYLLVFFSGLNHFHKPISEALDTNFARSVMTVSQNFSNTTPVWTWFVGGLNFHIEHHLFATMPRHNYRVIAPEIQEFCERHGFTYSTCTFPQAVAALWGKLDEPFAQEETVRAPRYQTRSGFAALESAVL